MVVSAVAAACAPPATTAAQAPFDTAETLGHEALAELGTTLVVAPHADDETLGCGGLLALLGDAAQAVFAVLVSDGTASHPHSRRFDARARAALRNAEWQTALCLLGVPAERLRRLDLADGDVPHAGDARFAAAAARLRAVVDRIAPATILVPWRRDSHPDHRATNELVRAAVRRSAPAPRLLEYIVWTAERAAPADLPRPGEMRTWRLDVDGALERKRRAIAAHRSQLGEVIDDDPGGFTIPRAMRRRAEAPVEWFFEEIGSVERPGSQ